MCNVQIKYKYGCHLGGSIPESTRNIHNKSEVIFLFPVGNWRGQVKCGEREETKEKGILVIINHAQTAASNDGNSVISYRVSICRVRHFRPCGSDSDHLKKVHETLKKKRGGHSQHYKKERGKIKLVDSFSPLFIAYLPKSDPFSRHHCHDHHHYWQLESPLPDLLPSSFLCPSSSAGRLAGQIVEHPEPSLWDLLSLLWKPASGFCGPPASSATSSSTVCTERHPGCNDCKIFIIRATSWS